MIAIFSEESDISTDNVIEWLHYYGQDFIRLNDENRNSIQYLSISNEDLSLCMGPSKISLADITATWFRRGIFTYSTSYFANSIQSGAVNNQVLKQLQHDTDVLSAFVYKVLQEGYAINHPAIYNVNKLYALFLAKRAGLNIPPSLVCSNIDDLNRVFPTEQLITKTMGNNVEIVDGNKVFSTGTRAVDQKPDKFFYSLFQQQIKRFCEIRSFFLHNNFYSMAIFVDEDLEDARSLAFEGQLARMVPFNLPEDIKLKLNKMVTDMNIDSGSIDLILTRDGEYYFLEVNPAGQYDHVDYNCNYYISKKIAEDLIANGK